MRFSRIFIFALIPLVLSIGISPALSFDFTQDAFALKAKGTSLSQYGSANSPVCGDRLCSEPVKREIPEEIMEEKIVEDSIRESGERPNSANRLRDSQVQKQSGLPEGEPWEPKRRR